MIYVLLAESAGTHEQKETHRHHNDEGQLEENFMEREVDEDETEENEGI